MLQKEVKKMDDLVEFEEEIGFLPELQNEIAKINRMNSVIQDTGILLNLGQSIYVDLLREMKSAKEDQ